MRRILFGLLACLFTFTAWAQTPTLGVVVMHGKGGAPRKLVGDLATYLEREGCLVANLEMPWSGRREYDVGVAAAEAQVDAALAELRGKGATRVFLVGHSQGGVFAFYYAGRHTLDGLIVIAPGGNVGNSLFREKLGETLEQARQLVAEGKGQEKARLADYEGSKGVYPIITAPAIYLEWFDPAGPMNSRLSIAHMRADTPVLYVSPKGAPARRKPSTSCLHASIR
jgi:pimeloyl-ACP methyl ester carboxylesterase